MNSAIAKRSRNVADQLFSAWESAPSKRRRLLAKSIEALSAPSMPNGSVRPLSNRYFNEMVAIRAYCKAEKRGFEPGFELDDWLAAERELLGVPAYFFD